MVISALGTSQRDWLFSVQGIEAVPGPETDAPLVARTSARLDHQALRRQANLDCILYRALSILPKGTDKEGIEKGEIDVDWAPKMLTLAADCGDPERQAIWARLLVMEVAKPGSVPPVAAELMSRMTGEMLEHFRDLARLTIDNFVVRVDEDYLAEAGLTSNVILLLEEYGLLRANRDLSKIFRSQKEDSFSTNLLYADKILRVKADDPSMDLNFQCLRLTQAGAALAEAIAIEEGVTTDTGYIIEIVRLFQRKGYKVEHADILERSGPDTVRRHTSFCELVVL
ncbi:MAG: DUF2806 domain-containing protein [Rhodospirillaceae bacterium]|nr:DUF2806 domain-containing protein [Rhodospirillaceae bacterium]MBT6139896.1 DUF2806 domain-containing protein [Rhodospirillaceae bacterium]